MKRILFFVAAIAIIMLALSRFDQTTSAQVPPVDQRKACLECHSDMQDLFKMADVHPPLEQGKCSSCHNPHASRHMKLLKDDLTELCGNCHTAVPGWTTKASEHQPVKEGKCMDCHTPHASNNQRLLVKPAGKELCSSCHAQVKDWLARTHQHDPVKKGECLLCHDPHATDNPRMLRQTEATLCLSCHQATPDFRAKHRGFNPQSVTCTACHDPHGSNSPNLLMKEQHPPFASGECSVCHVAAANASGYPLKMGRQEVCAQCHAEEVDSVSKYHAHGSTSESSCEKCHNPHASDEKNLISAPQSVLCKKCHDPSKGAELPTPNPHAGLQCATCHQPHGSSNEFYLKKPPMDLCQQCHSMAKHIAHPMGKDTTDPVRGGIVNCISCHDLHQWKFPKLLPADPERELCVRCHREK